MTYKTGNAYKAHKKLDREMDIWTIVYAILLLGTGLVFISELIFYITW